ncbi:MAG: hypothetical protein ACRDWI_02700 [Jiangellaceae bacterium]
MTRLTWRVLRTELLRGVAAVAAAAFAISGAAMLYNETEDWAGRWAPLAEYLRGVMLMVLVPMVVAAGAWQAGRERRRRVEELLGSTARSLWRRVVVPWAAVTLGTWLGLFLVWLSGAVLVAPVATYPGRWWWLTLSVAFVAPIAAVVAYAGLGCLLSTTWPRRSPASPPAGSSTAAAQ